MDTDKALLAQIAKLNKEIRDMSAVFGTVNAEIVAERDARMEAEGKLHEVDCVLHAGEDVTTVEAAELVMGRFRVLFDAVVTRYAAVYAAQERAESISPSDMDAYDQVILAAKDACARFFDDAEG